MRTLLAIALTFFLGCGSSPTQTKQERCNLPLIESDRYICEYILNGSDIQHSACKLSLSNNCVVSVDCTKYDSDIPALKAIKTDLTNSEVQKDIFYYGDYVDETGTKRVLSCKLN